MDLLRKHHGGPAIDVIRLDILMQYYTRLGEGTAALQWSDPMAGGPLIQAHLVALLYGRILCVHQETRHELFARVGELALQNVRSRGTTGFEFAPWVLHAGREGRDLKIWPWLIVPPEQITSPTIYTAILKLGEPTSKTPAGRWVQLDMPTELERLLAPSSALIAIAGFSKACDQVSRYFLARLLWQMNVFWESPNQVSLFSETLAYAAADAAIRSGPFRIP